MSLFDGQRLDPSIFKLDVDRLRRGWYTDHYFNLGREILKELAREGYRFEGKAAVVPSNVDPGRADVGDLEIDMQVFCKRSPFVVVAGTDHVLAMLATCTGEWNERGQFVSTADRLDIRAVHDGEKVEPWEPVLRVRGRYRDFAILETPILGALTRRTKIATNVYHTLVAAGGKPVLYFPARFDAHEVQAGDGYAYKIGVERFNRDHREELSPFISTAAQGDWWGMEGGGTVAHAYLLCFLRDTAEAMLQFARHAPASTPRVALVDVNNDCVGDSLAVAIAFFEKHEQLTSRGELEEAQKYVLFGVRADTARNIVDRSIVPIGDMALDGGVNPRLIWAIRKALDEAPERFAGAVAARAREYFGRIRIVASGGFTPERIRRFEELRVPVDIYGVGSYLLWGEPTDFTADVVMVRIENRWIDMAKEGRRARENPRLEPVALPVLADSGDLSAP
jgi:nicotinate phosphoribosyltransferase